MTTTERVARTLSRPTPIEALVWFRVAFGSILLWEVWRYFSKGWIKSLWIDPSFHFKYYGFAWIEPWPGNGMLWHFVGLGVCAALIALGFCYRAAAILFFAGFSYVFLLDQATYLNHFYLIALMAGIAVFLSPHRALSLDALLRPGLRSAWVPAWQLGLLRFQIALVYVFAGVAKLNADWIAGLPMKLWLAKPAAELGAWGAWLATDAAARTISWGGLAFDLLVVPALLWRRTRVAAFVVAVGFHLCNAWFFSIGIFPWLMIALTALFFPAGAWQRAASRLRRAPRSGATVPRFAPLRPAALCALALYVAFQIGFPLRHWAYPGDVAWSEEGHRFAWRMKLRDKRGRVSYRAVDPSGAVVERFDPGDYLNRHQVRELAARPDMIVQFAHLLRREMIREGRPAAAIHADARVRLNGAPARTLIDPDWNLAAAPRDLGAAKWILPRDYGASLSTNSRPHSAQRSSSGESAALQAGQASASDHSGGGAG